MPLYIFLVEDSNGKGRVVGYSFLSNETKDTLENLNSALGKIHDLDLVKTVIIDKDVQINFTLHRKIYPMLLCTCASFTKLSPNHLHGKPKNVGWRSPSVRWSVHQFHRWSLPNHKTCSRRRTSSSKHAPDSLVEYYKKNVMCISH